MNSSENVSIIIKTFRQTVYYAKSLIYLLKQQEPSVWGVHPFCLETYKNNDMHGRHFSSPYSGTIEDPATGTASGVMGAYYLKYINKTNSVNLKIEQGQEIGKDALIGVNIL